MPFHIVKVRKGFKVIDDKGRLYSDKPLSEEKAHAQQRALYAAYNNKRLLHGKGYYVMDGRVYYGKGFFSNVLKKARDIITAIPRAVVRRVGDVARGIRQGYPPDVRAVIGEYGDGVVMNINVRRAPIQSFVDKALNLITMGRWQKAKEDLNYDKMYHLGMVVSLRMPDGLEKAVLIEKNQVINITPSFTMMPNMTFVRVPVQHELTLRQMLDNAQQYMGKDYFLYDPFQNNCQNFIDGILTANDLNTVEARKFVLQPVDELLKKLPGFTGKVGRTLTDIAALADVALKGRAIRRGGAATKAWFDKQKAMGRLKQYASFEDMVGQQQAAQQQAARNAAETAAAEEERRATLQPGEELVACRVKDDLSKGRNVVSKQRCQELHDARFAKWEAENHPANAKFFRPLVEGLTKVADMAVDNVPGISSIAKEAYKTFAPPGSQYYKPGTVAEKAVGAVMGQGKNWIQDVKLKEGSFTRQAKEHKMKPVEFASYVLEHPEKFHMKTQRRAQFLKNIHGKGHAPIKISYKDFIEEHKKLLSVLKKPTPKALADELKEQTAEVKKVIKGGCGCGCSGGVALPFGYEKEVKRVAKRAGYDPKAIQTATDGKHKFIYNTPDGKRVPFGREGMGDFIIYTLLEKNKKVPEGTAAKHRDNYLARATKIKGFWREDKYSANNLAIRILWSG